MNGPVRLSELQASPAGPIRREPVDAGDSSRASSEGPQQMWEQVWLGSHAMPFPACLLPDLLAALP